jgi:hypothetical protein
MGTGRDQRAALKAVEEETEKNGQQHNIERIMNELIVMGVMV